MKCITTHLLRLIQTTLLPLSLLMAVDVIFKRGLVHVVADHRAEGADAVTLLVLIQFVLGDAGEALAAVTTHQRLKWRRQHIRGRNGIASGLSFKSASKINPKQPSHSREGRFSH